MIRRLTLSLALLAVVTPTAFAQPTADTKPKPKTNNPPNNRPAFMTAEEEQKLFADTNTFMNMGPKQQKAQMRKLTQDLLRSALVRAGFKDPQLQTEVVQFVEEQEKSREEARAVAAKLYAALEAKETPIDDAQIKALTANYLSAVESVKSKRALATKALDQKLSISTKPHLLAFLSLNGIIGDGPSVTGDVIEMGALSLGSIHLERDEKAPALPATPVQPPAADAMGDFMNMTPAQQKQALRATNQAVLRQVLTNVNFKDQQLQDDILFFVDEQEKSREDVRKAATKIYLALEPLGVPTDAAGMKVLLTNYASAIDKTKVTRETATKSFETKNGLPTNPRLRALLLLTGIIGDASSLTGDTVMSGMMATGSYVINPGDRPK